MTLLDHIDELGMAANRLQAYDADANVAGCMSACAAAMHALQEIAPLLVERGAQAGMTQRRMARLLDIPESALRGARREFAA